MPGIERAEHRGHIHPTDLPGEDIEGISTDVPECIQGNQRPDCFLRMRTSPWKAQMTRTMIVPAACAVDQRPEHCMLAAYTDQNEIDSTKEPRDQRHAHVGQADQRFFRRPAAL